MSTDPAALGQDYVCVGIVKYLHGYPLIGFRNRGADRGWLIARAG